LGVTLWYRSSLFLGKFEGQSWLPAKHNMGRRPRICLYHPAFSWQDLTVCTFNGRNFDFRFSRGRVFSSLEKEDGEFVALQHFYDRRERLDVT
jgi:hypothetical protein